MVQLRGKPEPGFVSVARTFALTPSMSAARAQGLIVWLVSTLGAGAVSAMKRLIAAETAAASSGVAVLACISIRGLGGRRLPFDSIAGTLVQGRVGAGRVTLPHVERASIPVIPAEAVLAAVSPEDALVRTRHAFERYQEGAWTMPSKVYLDSPPGDFRAMPARGDGFALLKWVTSFPSNPARGLPVVTGVVILSDAESGQELAILDCRSVTWLRTGAAAAVSAQALAREDAKTIGLIGSGVNGAWAARCLTAAGYGPGVCHDSNDETARALADELGWRAVSREEAVAQDVVATCTPGAEPVVFADDLKAGQHYAVLGADGHGKAEVEREVLRHCSLFCDEWDQAAAGGELAGAVAAGGVRRPDVGELGGVLTGRNRGRVDAAETTLFDSTGLAIQDLGIAIAVWEAWKDGRIGATEVSLSDSP